ncbi:MAG TPA: hypothetical protein VKD67_02780 [Acidimicrobiales bacterium]|nr:hypothetical protein [Acidimicrobiales bacterium]
MSTRPALLVAVVTACGLLTGCWYNRSAAAPAELSFVIHPTALAFITPTGESSSVPAGPLAPGSRVLGSDDLLIGGVVAGHDNEVCTVSFELNVLCDDMLSFSGTGDVHATWTFQWPTDGSAGPATFDGVVAGGTGAYRGAVGAFHAVALPNRDVQITGSFSR